MFSSNQIIVNNYIPYYPKKKDCLHDTLLIGKYNQIYKNLPEYFDNVQLINFDLINHELKGTPLTNSVEYYQQIRQQHFQNISNGHRYHFVSSAIKANREDINIEKNLVKNHFVSAETKQKLK